ncbi:putative Zn-dependent protease with chaperone function [Vibrio nigripulchritudo SO65]|uniref:M48 family metallopeptidase n=1 Tax=Vibrio nigripulchritudo TaxID=28173 RepID=UPI0003B1AEDE|nr:M48 family metallopeptidase [Vibrio nigripulchritudo]CCN35174.1 putative Zn-dependent protease with chaperone function [Vibrio nigripulchritudo AM115]CCN42197.1 putative Zn-dependent protease with chaperone function [Vibrio nigripulchritudo FTn2]CCN63056.1 putative Zn-dependent protease with chaperone function [Vibrio nigripulchritudo POn4]CCN75592.1 putative Zn-dependent protease with chaperone function [Vibrio nigripulchritudo SO65]
MRTKGMAHPPLSSAKSDAELDLSQRDFMYLHVDGQIVSASIHDIEVTPSPGKLPPKIRFPSGWLFVPEQADEVNAYLKKHGKKGLLGKLETNLTAILVSALLIIGLTIGTFTHGIPWFSQQMVDWVPDEAHETLADYVLESIDEEWLLPSELFEDEQARIRERFYAQVQSLPPTKFQPQLEFRKSGDFPNAFALSGGVIIMLDEMVELAESDEEVDAILLHELGHIHHQHVMKRLISSSLVSATVALLTGESSGMIDTMVGAGVFLMQSGHSREAEREADEYAKASLITLHGSSEPLAKIFERLHESAMDIPEWLSTHPDMEERIEEAREP